MAIIELDPMKIKEYLRQVKYGSLSIESRECKHATYSVDRVNRSDNDLLTVKEWITLSNGIRVPNVRTLLNYERPYWITKKQLRNHPEKLEFEHLKNLDKFKSTQIKLARDLCYRMGYGNPSNGLKMIARSPYIYGLDVTPEAFLKQSYMDRYPGSFVPNDVTVADAETDLTADYKKPILWSRVTDTGIWLYVNRQWAGSVPNYEDHVRNEYFRILEEWIAPIKQKLANKHGEYPAYLDNVAKLPLTVVTHDDDYEITEAMMLDIHASHTDILTGWNFMYDCQVIAEVCERHGKDLASLMSDSKVPYEYRHTYFKEGPSFRISSSGVKTNLGPQERWHLMLSSSTFRIVDAMQIHWQLRKALGKESGGYGLDALSQRHLGAGKANFPNDSILPSGSKHWHSDMQANFKVNYGVYAIVDSILVKIKDWKDNDLSQQLSSLAGSCDYSRFNSQPTVNATDMLFTTLKDQKKVITSTSDDMETELDKLLIPMDGWIVTFPSFNVQPKGVKALKGLPDVQSTIYMYNSDADVETTYPVAEIITNLSKDTTVAEPVCIKDVTQSDLRLIAVNMTGGPSNALEILQMTAKVPLLSEWLEEAKKDITVAHTP